VALAVVANLGLLGYFKYANFIVDNLNILAGRFGIGPFVLDRIQLPIGISFFTFQALSYVIDIYRGEAEARRNPLDVGLYIALFSQLIAGPILRYRTIATQISRRTATLEGISEGIQRFTIGLGKKMILANTVGAAADQIFGLNPARLTTSVAWLGLLCYTFQIYFAFSGYSDMAIGLGRMFGFRFPENFNYPYIAQSLRDFWRRWHISLSTWFRDYLYIPLGGGRRSPARVALNLFLVFFLCGLWHGASWNFVIWGMTHGTALAAERAGFERLLARAARPFRHLYALSIVMFSWVVFRAETLPDALAYYGALLGFARGDGVEHPLYRYLTAELALVLLLCVVASLPLWPAFPRWREELGKRGTPLPPPPLEYGASLFSICYLGSILLACAALLAAGTHNPFIYFRF